MTATLVAAASRPAIDPCGLACGPKGEFYARARCAGTACFLCGMLPLPSLTTVIAASTSMQGDFT